MKTVIKIEGGRELDANLLALAEEFSPRNARNVMRGALDDGGKIIAEAAAALAPDDPQTGGKRNLKTNIVSSGTLSKSQKAEHEKQSAMERYIGPTTGSFHGFFQELGTAHHAAHPFLRPAFDSNWRRVLEVILQRTAERLEATRKRLVRNAQSTK